MHGSYLLYNFILIDYAFVKPIDYLNQGLSIPFSGDGTRLTNFSIFAYLLCCKHFLIELGCPPILPLQEVKFFIYCTILRKFETKQYNKFTNNNWDRNLWIRTPLSPGAPLPSLPPPLKKIEFFIYWPILMKFET